MTEAALDENEKSEHKGQVQHKPVRVVEQRFSNLGQGLLTLGTMTGPLLTVLHLVPHGVLAGLFFVMGIQALEDNGITVKLLYLLRDQGLTFSGHPLKAISKKAVWWFVMIELVGFGATFAITQTIAAVGFPVFIFILIPVRALLLPRWFSPRELSLLDEPTASDFTMESCGGTYGAEFIEGEGSSADSSEDEAKGGVMTGRSKEDNVSSSRVAKSDIELAEEGQAGGLSHRHHHHDV